MSLDVYLHLEGATKPHGSGIFFREDGVTRELTRAEWDERFPGREPVTFSLPVTEAEGTNAEVFTANITHNMCRMADEVGIYEVLWRPEQVGITHAHALIEPLRQGLARLLDEEERLQVFNPENGWGNHEVLVNFVRSYLEACETFPMATVKTWR